MSGPSDPLQGHNVSWEGVRVANLLDFASATPDQKLAWLGQMLELYNEIHGLARGAKRHVEGRAGGGAPNDPTA